jgi:hypothetical protein
MEDVYEKPKIKKKTPQEMVKKIFRFLLKKGAWHYDLANSIVSKAERL